jgi:inosose dehydratase
MSTIAVGSGVIDIDGAFAALVSAGFDGFSTLEVGGDDAVLASAEYLQALGAVR